MIRELWRQVWGFVILRRLIIYKHWHHIFCNRELALFLDDELSLDEAGIYCDAYLGCVSCKRKYRLSRYRDRRYKRD